MADPESVAPHGTRWRREGIDVLVNNAAINPRGRVTPEEVDRAWQTNTLGPWRVSQTFLPPMRERGWGRIVNVSTEVATDGRRARGGGIYAVDEGRDERHDQGARRGSGSGPGSW